MKTKTESITVRLTPRLVYALKLITRIRHCSQSSVISILLEERAEYMLETGFKTLWHPVREERLKLLKEHEPSLLSYEEEMELLNNEI